MYSFSCFINIKCNDWIDKTLLMSRPLQKWKLMKMVTIAIWDSVNCYCNYLLEILRATCLLGNDRTRNFPIRHLSKLGLAHVLLRHLKLHEQRQLLGFLMRNKTKKNCWMLLNWSLIWWWGFSYIQGASFLDFAIQMGTPWTWLKTPCALQFFAPSKGMLSMKKFQIWYEKDAARITNHKPLCNVRDRF